MKRQYFLLLLHLLCIFWTNAEPLVEISQGILNGTIEESRNGRKYAAFLGIPYAESPIGNLRFRNPLPAKNWQGIRQATTFGNVCPQIRGGKINGNEDCLFLNIYTPLLEFDSSLINEKTNKKLFPVMLWIHGGGFHAGTGNSARGNYLLDKDIILVTINYRLEALGFFSLGNSAAMGNYGLKDQVMALKWVQKNIKSFGGDPKKVTIFGESAGGGSVALHALSKASTGLFHQYIIQSGSPIGAWAFTKRNRLLEYAKKIGFLVSCEFNTSESFVDCLRTKSVESLLNVTSIFGELGETTKIGWTTTDEPEGDDAFLTDSPLNLMNQNQMKDLPFITGSVTAEGLSGSASSFTNPPKFSDAASYLNKLIPFIASPFLNSKNEKRFTEAVKKFYFNNSIDPTENDKFTGNLTNFMSDGYFLYPQVTMLEKVAPKRKNSIYFYSFGYQAEGNKNEGVHHGGELAYIFPPAPSASGSPSHNFTKTQELISELMIDLWTSFAINGKPTSKKLKNDDLWTPYDLENRIHFEIGNINSTDPSLTLSNLFFENRMNFWRKNAPV